MSTQLTFKKALELYFRYRTHIKRIHKISAELDKTLDSFEDLTDTREFKRLKKHFTSLMTSVIEALISAKVIKPELKREK